jgi:pyrroline-5-carboxylate reductase
MAKVCGMAHTDQDNDSLVGLSGSLVLIGAGKMGGAMLQGWLALGFDPGKAVVFEPQTSPDIAGLVGRGIKLNPPVASVGDAAAMVIAVKPQVAGTVVPTYASLARPGTVAVSIMAGQTLKALAGLLPPGAAIVRSMPNTPAAIGRGITAAIANAQVSTVQRDLAHRLLAAVGAVEWITDEALMDAVTAVSGSGPAYVFLLAEAMAAAGVAAGLPPALAAKLARETVAGSGELLHRLDLDAAVLRQNVTSPGGTTAAALEVLMASKGLQPLMEKAVAAAARRSRELAG